VPMLSIGAFARLGEISPRMLRHYDEIGLLSPERVEAGTGYRWYDVAQLARLHRLLALRDLGFSLQQVSELLTDEPSVEQLRGMLRLRQSQIEATVEQEQARLSRIEAHLRALERTNSVTTQDIVIKHTQPLRIAEVTAVAPGPGPDNVGPIFQRLIPQVLAVLDRNGLTPGMSVGHYEDLRDDGSLVVHVGFEIDHREAITDDDRVAVVDLPVVEVASLMHHGSLDTLLESNEQLAHWVQDSGHATSGPSRELYLQWSEQDPASNITELQAVLIT
jgi:DNA-binding transcriptional MerR regulator